MTENADTLALGHLTVNLRNSTRSVEEALSEVDRELSVRVRCFGRWVDDRKLSAIDAKDRLERLVAAYRYLRELWQRELDRNGLKMPPEQGANLANSTPAALPGLTPGRE